MFDRRFVKRAPIGADRWEEIWPEFEDFMEPPGIIVPALKRRLKQGAETYGNGSFHRNLDELMMEIRNECLDIWGWSVVVFPLLGRRERRLLKSICHGASVAMKRLGMITD
jgi:hypothetical protein